MSGCNSLLVSNIPQSFETPLYFYQKNARTLSDIELKVRQGPVAS
jgi:hypothetical protein